MRRSPSIASSLPDDVEVYLVIETTSERDWAVPGARLKKRANLETVNDLLEGQYSNPVRIVAFNTAENWSHDVSEDIAHELGRRIALERRDVIPELEDFLERHTDDLPAQLSA